MDKGLEALDNGVQLMKPMSDLDNLLARAKTRNIFGTKIRSVIKEANKKLVENHGLIASFSRALTEGLIQIKVKLNLMIC